MPEVSFVVPTRNSGRTLEACLKSLRAQSGVSVEVIVVDDASTDATPEIAARWADRLLLHGPGRSSQRNAGWQASRARVVAFLDSDMVLDPGAASEAVASFCEDPGLGGLVVPEYAFGAGFFARCRAHEKRLSAGDPATEGARFFRRAAVELAGGYDESRCAAEDWEFSERIAADGWAIRRLNSAVGHDEGRLSLGRAFAKKRYYGRNFYDYATLPRQERRPFIRTSLVSSPARLAKAPALTAGLALLKAVEVGGMLCGMAEERRARRG
ncbi:glycosyltransferase [Yinghuangia seranimata]|uniref:glycosyltransferase n=1 Tax=Yinghuangia seranimata TaxID=408067 RepID=UPI00248B15B8|nr:glycosyltransferase family A protein [Yinghuangia seranimata]MDI2128792.1 glycosyltransferase family A protein [Yinghuangia seranimata]